MTVKELIIALHRYNQDLEVSTSWEGSISGLKEIRTGLRKPIPEKEPHNNLYVELVLNGPKEK